MANPSTDYISRRALAVDASGIRKVFDLAAKLPDPINFSIGQPDFDVPQGAKAAAIAAIQSGHNRYTQTQGIAPLRERLRRDLSREIGRDTGDVLITCGVSGGLFLAILACVDPGDEVIFLDPYFVMYKHLLTMAGGKAIAVDSYPDFRFPAARVEQAITPKTKAIILNSPSNPTGVVMTAAEVAAAVDIARRHDLLLISDEIYQPFLYADETKGETKGDRTLYIKGPVPFSFAFSSPSLASPAKSYDKTLILRGFSKSHAMTGWRLGYAAGPELLISQMAKLQQYTFVCAPAPLQHAALAALDIDMHDVIEVYRRKRDLVYEKLSRKFSVVRPEGAFYIFPQAPAGIRASEFVAKAIERNVLMIPGNVFSERDTHFRISYATTEAKLAEGCDILCAMA